MKRCYLYGLVFLACLVSLIGGKALAEDKTLPKVRLALNWKPEPQFGGFYSAQLTGLYAKHGAQVEVLPGGAGTPVVQMVAAGQMEFGVVSADEVVISRVNGGDVVALFAAYQTNPQGIMTHSERGFKSIAEVLAGEGTLALQKGLPYAMFLTKKYGKTKVSLVPYLGGITNFLSDKKFSQQCFVTSEPLAAKKAGASPKTFLVAEEGYNPYTTVLITRGDVLKKNPQLVKAVVDAVRAGWQQYMQNPEATNKMMAELNKSMDLATFGESSKAQEALIVTDETRARGLGVMTEVRWKQLVDQLYDLKLIKTKPVAKELFVTL